MLGLPSRGVGQPPALTLVNKVKGNALYMGLLPARLTCEKEGSCPSGR